MTRGFRKRIDFSRTLRLSVGALAFLGLSACEMQAPTSTATQEASRNAPMEVALLVPYGSSRASDAVVAGAIEQAARMAITDLQAPLVNLTVYNTAGNAATGAAMAQKAADNGAEVILGPLYADVAAAAAATVSDEDIPVLSFSNNSAIAGGNLYLLGDTFENRAARLLSFAASQGKGRVVVTHSNDTAGQAAANAMRTAARNSTAEVVASVAYDLSQQGVVSAVPTVRDSIRRNDATGLVLTSSASGALPLFAQLLPEAGISNSTTQFMGLARWDVPVEALALPGLQNGWFTLPDPALTSQFQARFQGTYGKAPHPLAGLGYDGIAALGVIARNGTPKVDSAALTSASGFAGVNGAFRLKADGTNERALAVAQIVNSQIQVISPAPRRFNAAGS